MNINNPKILTVTDGSQGMISQVMGLSNHLSSNVTEIKTDLIFPWNKLQPGILPTFKWIFKNKIPKNNQPNIIISCGRKSVYFSLYCKRKYQNLISIHIQNPKISAKKFDYIISPNHDNFQGSNVINSVGALHHFKKINQKYNQKLISCIVGGNSKHYHFNTNQANKLCNKLIEIKESKKDIKLNVITSRRTSNLVKKILTERLKNIATIWTGFGENPYEKAIQNSSFFIITSDSTSMISEAAISGRPIYIHHLDFKRKSKRMVRFHKEFSKIGITRNIKNIKYLDNWSYNSLNESERIARIIKKRIIEDKI